MTKDDIVTNINAYESGMMNDKQTLEFFADLIKTGTVWHLQGSYHRAAHAFIDNGYIKTDGTILKGVNE